MANIMQQSMMKMMERQGKLIQHLQSQINVANRNLRKIYNIWDSFFKTAGTLVLVCLEVTIFMATKHLYDLNGKWHFGRIVFGGICYVIVTVLGLIFIWWITNKLLINRVELNNQ